MKYRYPALLLCALGIVLSWLLPTMVRAIHDAHGMSTAHEFHAYQLIDRERLEAVRTEYNMPDYSVEQRVRAVGGIHFYLPIVSVILATLFGVIGILVWMADSATVVGQSSVCRDLGRRPVEDEQTPSKSIKG